MKKVIIIIFISLLAAAGVVYYFYNKPHDTVEQHEAIPKDAVELVAAFAADEKVATAEYLGKVIMVSGKPTEITKNEDGRTVVFFSEDGIFGVQCTMRDVGVNLRVGRPVQLRGFCNGYTTVVLLSDCVLEK